MSPRPTPIRIFGWLLLAATLVSLGVLLTHDGILADNPRPGGGTRMGALLAMMLVSGYNLCFWVAIARRANNTARWFFVALTLVGLVNIGLDWHAYAVIAPSYVVLSLGATALQTLAALLLLTPSAGAWLRARGRIHDETDIFA